MKGKGVAAASTSETQEFCGAIEVQKTGTTGIAKLAAALRYPKHGQPHCETPKLTPLLPVVQEPIFAGNAAAIENAAEEQGAEQVKDQEIDMVLEPSVDQACRSIGHPEVGDQVEKQEVGEVLETPIDQPYRSIGSFNVELANVVDRQSSEEGRPIDPVRRSTQGRGETSSILGIDRQDSEDPISVDPGDRSIASEEKDKASVDRHLAADSKCVDPPVDRQEKLKAIDHSVDRQEELCAIDLSIDRQETKPYKLGLAADNNPILQKVPRTEMAPPGRKKEKKDLEETYVWLTRAYGALEKEVVPTCRTTTLLYQKLLKEISSRKRAIERVMQDRPDFSTVIPRKMPSKVEDPGKFTIPCKIGKIDFPRCLLDTGSCVSVMPHTLAIELNMTNFKEPDGSIIMGDNSEIVPVGILADVPVEVGGEFILTDFTVMEMKETREDPIILGRAFMATAGARIDVAQGWIELNLGSSKVEFGATRPLDGTRVKQRPGRKELNKPKGAAEGANITKPLHLPNSGAEDNMSLDKLLKELDSREDDGDLLEAYVRLRGYLNVNERIRAAKARAREDRPWVVTATIDVPDGRTKGVVRKPTGFS